MRWALRPWASLASMAARQGVQSLGRPAPGTGAAGAVGMSGRPAAPLGALAGFGASPGAGEPMGAMAGFESPSAPGEPMGALAGFAAGAWRRWRATVSRWTPSSRAMRRWDQPR